MSSKHLSPPPLQQQIARSTKFFYWCSLRWSFVLASTFQRYIFWWVSVKCFKKAKQSQLRVEYFAGLVRKKKAGAWSPLASFYLRRVVITIDDQKNNIASLCFASYLAANWLQKLKTKHCLLHRSYFSYVWVCGISVWFIYNKRNYLFVRCQSLSHIPNTSLWCSNQPLWKFNLMMGVNTTKQQTGEIKNTKRSNLVDLNRVRKQPHKCPGKKDVPINNCFESC